MLVFALEVHADDGLASLLDDLEGEMLHVGLDLSVGELSTDEALGVEDCVDRVHGDLVLCGIADQSFGVGERHKGWRCTVSLITDYGLVCGFNGKDGKAYLAMTAHC